MAGIRLLQSPPAPLAHEPVRVPNPAEARPDRLVRWLGVMGRREGTPRTAGKGGQVLAETGDGGATRDQYSLKCCSK